MARSATTPLPLLLLLTYAANGQAIASDHPGKAIYESTCAACHANTEITKAPAFETLKRMRYQTILYAVTKGKMQTQAQALSDADRVKVVDYLAGREVANDAWIAKTMCPANRKAVNVDATATVSGFGFDARNRRNLTKQQTGLATQDFRNLELAWAMGFSQATAMRSQPAILGNTLFLPVADNSRLFAIDIAGEPCLKWVYENDVPLRTSAAFGVLPKSKKKVVVFSDLGANVHMVDAETGTRIWKQPVGLFPFSLLTGTPAMHDDKVYVPISQYEISVGANDNHECCKSHGAVTALDAVTGKTVWTAHTMENAKPLRDRGDGQMIWGPSGAPIWNSPAIDAKRGVLYVGTGEATSEPAAPTTDAILAIDLKDGAIRWSFQATANDIFLTGCGGRPPNNVGALTAPAGANAANRPRMQRLNCPLDSIPRDADFGASAILGTLSSGKDVVLAGQKSGTVWALDPDNNGKLLWRQDFGRGSPLGGIHWGIAFDGKRVYAPINLPGAPAGNALDSMLKPGIHAMNVDDGKVLWSFASEPDCSEERKQRMRGCGGSSGMSGAPTIIDGAVVQGSVDGLLRALDATSGELLFKFDTAQQFATVNGVVANGGAMDSATIVAANGYLFVQSGYGLFGGAPGNVLLAFKVKQPVADK